MGGEQKLVFADDGAVALEYPPELAFVSPPSGPANRPVLLEWHFSPRKTNDRLRRFRSLRPLYKFTWPNGDDVYVSQETGPGRTIHFSGFAPGRLFRSDSTLVVLHSAKKGWHPVTRVVVWTFRSRNVRGIFRIDRRRVDVFAVAALSPPRRFFPHSIPGRSVCTPSWACFSIARLHVGLPSGMLSMDPFPMGGEASLDSASRIQICPARRRSAACRILEHPPARSARPIRVTNWSQKNPSSHPLPVSRFHR